MIQAPDMGGWVRVMKLDLSNPETLNKLTECFSARMLEIAWDRNFYPLLWVRGNLSPQVQETIEKRLVRKTLERLKAERPLIFARTVIRRRGLRGSEYDLKL